MLKGAKGGRIKTESIGTFVVVVVVVVDGFYCILTYFTGIPRLVTRKLLSREFSHSIRWIPIEIWTS